MSIASPMGQFVQNLQACPLILIVQSRRAIAAKIMADLREVYPGGKVGHALDLSEAYNLSEHAHPDLVVLDITHTEVSGLPMFLSLLSALAIEWVFVHHGLPSGQVPIKQQVTIRGLQDYLMERPAMRSGGPHHADGLPSTLLKNAALSAQRPQWKTVVMGASTGGIESLIEVLSGFPSNGPPTVIVQHINCAFLTGLADRLDRLCAANVRAAQAEEVLQPGQILLAPGDAQHLVIAKGGRLCRLETGPPSNGHRPSVDALFQSAAAHLGPNCVGILLSGMGCDGASGLLDIRKNQGWTIAQNEASCAVYGMPRAAVQMGAVMEQLPVPQICDAALIAASTAAEITQNA